VIERRSRRARLVLWLAFVYFSLAVGLQCARRPAWDFAVNWSAAQGLRRGLSLYDPAGQRPLALALVGPWMGSLFDEPLRSYTNPPSTSLVFLPFTVLSFPAALALFRVVSLAAFAAGILAAAACLPAEGRRRGRLVGFLGLFVMAPAAFSIRLGQVDGFIVATLGLCLLAQSRGHFGIAGLFAGVAGLLKISPFWMVAYLLLLRRWRAAITAAVAVAFLLASAAALGRSDDLPRFAFQVAPMLGGGSLHQQNQSLPAWLGRLSLPGADPTAFAPLGSLALLGPILACLLTFAVWIVARCRDPVGGAALVVLAMLLGGPITWDHYLTWALVPAVLLSDERLWAGLDPSARTGMLLALFAGFALLALPGLTLSRDAIDAWPALRVLTGLRTVGLVLVYGAGLRALARSGPCPS
jgi:hypothetical protein